MDVLRLDKTTYLPDKIIEGYSSMIWTERYLDPGEFELKTPLIKETMALLPEMSLISLHESKDVMLVESHSIGRGSDGPELTVTGRSLDIWLEHRIIEGDYQQRFKMAQHYTRGEAALVILWNSVANTSARDVTRATSLRNTTSDVIPNTVVTDSTTVTGNSKRRWLQEGPAYPQFHNYLRSGKLGVRMVRPKSTNGKVVTVTSATAERGVITRTNTPSISALRFDIFNGVDRSRLQSTNPSVIFITDNIDNPEYLLSIKDYKNLAEVVSSVGKVKVYRVPGVDSLKTGFDLRIIHVDAGSPGPDESKPEFLEDLPDYGEEALEANNRATLFNGEISSLAPYKYDIHYSLGDKVTLLAEYGLEQTMIVSEYIRTEDKEGDRGYPGLVVAG